MSVTVTLIPFGTAAVTPKRSPWTAGTCPTTRTTSTKT
jgi:hypothetical protein